MPYSQDRPRRSSYPSPPHCTLTLGKSPDQEDHYRAGVALARDFLHEVRCDLREHAGKALSLAWMQARFEALLAWARPPFRAGFLQTLMAYLLLTLEGCEVDPASWDVAACLAQSPPH